MHERAYRKALFIKHVRLARILRLQGHTEEFVRREYDLARFNLLLYRASIQRK